MSGLGAAVGGPLAPPKLASLTLLQGGRQVGNCTKVQNWPRTCLKCRKKAKRARFLEIKSTSLSEKRLDSPHECELVHEQLDRVQ